MACIICFEDITVDELYSAHEGQKHDFHKNCIARWLEISPDLSLNCPFCREPLEHLEKLFSSCMMTKNTAKALFMTNKPFFLKLALDNWYFKRENKVTKLYELAGLGLSEAFEVVYSSLGYAALLSCNYDHILEQTISNGRFECFQFLLEKGYVQVFDVMNSFEKVVCWQNQEMLEQLFELGITHYSGPRIEDQFVGCLPVESLIYTAVLSKNLDILKLLLSNGYSDALKRNEHCYDILGQALRSGDKAICELLFEHGLEVCSNNCAEFKMAAQYKNLEVLKWFIEQGGCTHKETWRLVRAEAYSRENFEVYVYLSGLLDEEMLDLTEAKLKAACKGPQKYYTVKGLMDEGADLCGFFPSLSNLVISLDDFLLLTSQGCRVVPGPEVFLDALIAKRLDLIPKFLEMGLRIDSELFDRCFDKYGKMWKVVGVLEVFYQYGVEKQEAEEVWEYMIHSDNIDSVRFLLGVVEMEWLFVSKKIVTLLSERSSMRSIVMVLVEEGLPVNSFDSILVENSIKQEDIEMLRFLLSKDDSIDLIRYLNSTMQTFEHFEFFSAYFNLIDVTKLDTETISNLGHFLVASAGMDILERLEDAKIDLPFSQILRRIVQADDIEFFLAFTARYNNIQVDRRELFIQACEFGSYEIVQHLLGVYGEDLRVDEEALEASKKSGKKILMFMLAKLHSSSCKMCSHFSGKTEPDIILDQILAMSHTVLTLSD